MKLSAFTSVLTGDEIDPLAEFYLKATVAHEVLQSDSGYCTSSGTLRAVTGFRNKPIIPHPFSPPSEP